MRASILLFPNLSVSDSRKLCLYSLHYGHPSVHNVMALHPLYSQKAAPPRGFSWGGPVECTDFNSLASFVRKCQNMALLENERVCRTTGQLPSLSHKYVRFMLIHGRTR
jgi:hypothetical protein